MKLGVLLAVAFLLLSGTAMAISQTTLAPSKTGNAVLSVQESIADSFTNLKVKGAEVEQELTINKSSVDSIQKRINSGTILQRQQAMTDIQRAKSKLLETTFNRLILIQSQVHSSINNSKKFYEKIQSNSKFSSTSKQSDYLDQQEKLLSLSESINQKMLNLEKSTLTTKELKQLALEIKNEIQQLKLLFQSSKDIAKELIKN